MYKEIKLLLACMCGEMKITAVREHTFAVSITSKEHAFYINYILSFLQMERACHVHMTWYVRLDIDEIMTENLLEIDIQCLVRC